MNSWRAYLDLLVRSHKYLDNFRPTFLRNPRTKAPLEYDRFYYVHKVAFEFQGDQHYFLTEDHPDPGDLAERQIRDLVKAGLSVKNDITIVEITDQDLSVEGMQKKIPDRLPLRIFRPDGPLVRTLEGLAREYAESIRRRRTTNYRSSASKEGQ